MDVVMAQQGLTPGMQNRKKSNLSAQPFRISSDFEQGLGTGVEEQIEKWPRRSQCQRVQFVRHGEHDVEVVGVERDPAAGPGAIAGAAAPGTWDSIVNGRSCKSGVLRTGS